MTRSATVQRGETKVRSMKRLASLLLAGAAALSAACLAQAPAAAQSYGDTYGAGNGSAGSFYHRVSDAEIVLAQASLSPRDALRAAEARFPGSRALDVTPIPRSGQARAYLVRIIINGDRLFVRVDARSGAVSGPCRSAAQCGG